MDKEEEGQMSMSSLERVSELLSPCPVPLLSLVPWVLGTPAWWVRIIQQRSLESILIGAWLGQGGLETRGCPRRAEGRQHAKAVLPFHWQAVPGSAGAWFAHPDLESRPKKDASG